MAIPSIFSAWKGAPGTSESGSWQKVAAVARSHRAARAAARPARLPELGRALSSETAEPTYTVRPLMVLISVARAGTAARVRRAINVDLMLSEAAK